MSLVSVILVMMMNKKIDDVTIDSLEKLSKLLLDQEHNTSIKRLRSAYFYRGLPNVDFNLLTSLQRNCGEQKQVLEPMLLKNFTKYAIMEEPTLAESVWQQMIIGQHHGLPTRLLDWTHSPLIALHFALTEGNLADLDKHDCVVWRMDMRDMNENLPQKYRDALNAEKTFVFSVEHLNSVVSDLAQYDADMGDCAMVNIEPPSVDQRIINQYSFFSVVPNGIDCVDDFLREYTTKTVRFIIKKELRWEARDLLDQYNVNERMVYPGLDGLTKWLARHYYVKR